MWLVYHIETWYSSGLAINTGCRWRQVPHYFPPYSTVHSFYQRARKNGLWDKILGHLVEKTRKNASRSPNPTYALIDSQGVKNQTL
jgi:transposase